MTREQERGLIDIDDELSIIKFLRANLEANGYEVLVAVDGAEALQTFERELPDLVILDIKMPRTDGSEVCRRLREWSPAPVIMLSAVSAEEDKVKCFDLGADDYISKPFGKDELIARVRAVLQRTTLWDEHPEPAFHSYDLIVNFAQHRVTLSSQEVNLTA